APGNREPAWGLGKGERGGGRVGGCTFDEDSDASLCDYRQGQEDDFDWQLIRTYSLPHATPDLLRGRPPYSILQVLEESTRIQLTVTGETKSFMTIVMKLERDKRADEDEGKSHH
ncbi:hypothetical protein NHX12_024328, partial [Muraenolepis orangiensis]